MFLFSCSKCAAAFLWSAPPRHLTALVCLQKVSEVNQSIKLFVNQLSYALETHMTNKAVDDKSDLK